MVALQLGKITIRQHNRGEFMSSLNRHARWLLAVLLVTALSTLVVFAPVLAQEAPAAPAAPALPASPAAQSPGPRQIFSGDFVVEGGQRIGESVFVYNGDATVQGGGVIAGSLVVFNGDITIQGGGSVEGDVTAYSGDIDIEGGHIGGDVSAMRGDIDLSGGSHVEGGVSAVSGRIRRSEGARIDGNVVQGPSFRFPGGPERDFDRDDMGFRAERNRGGFFGALIRLFLRLLGAILMTALVALIVGVLQAVRPELISRARETLRTDTALSFVVGLFGNLILLFLSGVLAVTICLLPIALVPMLVLLAVNVVGWAVASQMVGERVVGYLKQSVQPALTVAVGAVVLTGIASLLWAFGGCFRLLGFLFTLGVASFGAGALVVPWLNRQRGGSTGSAPTDGAPTGGSPAGGPAGSGPAGGGSTGGTGGGSRGPEQPDAPGARAAGPGGSDFVETDVDRPVDYVTAQEVNLTQERQQQAEEEAQAQAAADKPAAAPGDMGIADLDIDEPDDYVTAQEINAAQARAREDDFTRIKGIGPVFERRLKGAGVQTFAQLAAMTPAQVAEIIGWPEERVMRNEIIEQARALAG